MAAPVPAFRHIFLTGAPDASSLGWESSDLTDGFGPQFTRYLSGHNPRKGDQLAVTRQNFGENLPTWRLLPLVHQHLETGLTPASLAEQDDERWAQQDLSFHIPRNAEDASFFTTSDLSFDESQGRPRQDDAPLPRTEDEVLSQFYEHSLALHEAILSDSPSLPKQEHATAGPSAQPPEDSTLTTTPSSFDNSSVDGSTSFISTISPPRPVPVLPPAAKAALTRNLDDIPNAAYLHSISPQTMAVNLIVGILEIKSPRLIKTRRGTGKEMEIVEMLVGDETRSGFGINFWLWPERSAAAKKLGQRQQQNYNESKNLRDILHKLQPQDIILARNVALSSFHGQVYGQLLRMELARLYLLYRNPASRFDGDHGEETPCIYRPSELMWKEGTAEHLQTRKVRKVRDWVIHFVAAPVRGIAQRDSGKEGLMEREGSKSRWGIAGINTAMMPPDTPI
ncbi:MAG: hypothetical protein M1839_003259 [Geoglossum umbratile]|nr:MAG: hypothetical protein M1839_003259 [Geoglossum umbratile]